MNKFRKIWDDKKRKWLMANKGVPVSLCYEFFLLDFPDASDVSFAAFKNERSRIGAVMPHTKHYPRTPRPLYSEQVKKGYVRIKIAQPNVWIPKAKWVYMNAHPNEDLSERSNYIFLDGDNRNFSQENIERVPLRLMGVFNSLGGTGESAEITRARIVLAKLKSARLDAGEKLGLVKDYDSFRAFRSDLYEKRREYNLKPERRKINAEKQRERYRRIKETDPEKYKKIREKSKAYHKEYYRRRKEAK